MKSLSLERIIIVILCIALAATLIAWRPWSNADAQKITVVGTATIKQAPDEFIFNPTYQKKASTSKDALAQVSEIGNAAIAQLKTLGLSDDDLVTSVNTNQGYSPVPLSEGSGTPTPARPGSQDYTSTYQITATVHDKAVAQKVLDYIVTTPVVYSITPQSIFSKDAKKKLESQARQQGVQDAHQKAQDIADGLGAKLGSVVSVSEANENKIMPYYSGAAKSMPVDTSINTVPILETGSQEVTYSVTVVYSLH